jgi:hypothetical protein
MAAAMASGEPINANRRIEKRVPPLEQTQDNCPSLFEPARAHNGKEVFIKILDTIMALLAWVVFALVLWAIMPLLLKLVALANGVNHLFGL